MDLDLSIELTKMNQILKEQCVELRTIANANEFQAVCLDKIGEELASCRRDQIAARVLQAQLTSSQRILFSDDPYRKQICGWAYLWADSLIEAGRTPSAPQNTTPAT